ncbi:MAG: hypothetical protein Q8M08_03490 [Bacteroidales bacterium]|nr:hypothetical protein [Bacteroidales bacterium]
MYCFANDAAKSSKYGGLYQWDEMIHYDDNYSVSIRFEVSIVMKSAKYPELEH